MPPRPRKVRPNANAAAERLELEVATPAMLDMPPPPMPTEDTDGMLPSVWVAPKILPEHTHPACIGFAPTTTGHVRSDPEKIHPAFAGSAWRRTPYVVSQDPRSYHPSCFGYYESTRGEHQALPLEYDPALCTPVFAHPGLRLVPAMPEQLVVADRVIPPVHVASPGGLYLHEKVWPTLQRGMECMLKALKHKIAAAQRKSGRSVGLESVDFDPVKWLAQYLRWYNPNVPLKFSRESAACKIQSVFRGHRVRTHAKRLREARRKAEAAAEEARLRHRAATLIQAAYRGHRVRVYLAMGKRLDGITGGRGPASGAASAVPPDAPLAIFVS